MSIKFKPTSKSFKKKLKTGAPFIAMGVALVFILGLLIFPQRIGNAIERDARCKDLGFHGGGHLFYELCDKNFDKIIFVVGDTVNTPKPNLGFPNIMKDAYTKTSGVYAMSVSKPSKNPKKINVDGKDIDVAVAEYIEKMSAGSDGADYLEAIRTAVKFAGDDKEKTLIYVIGSGLSDKGLLNFADGNLLTLKDDAESIAEKAQEAMSEDSDDLESITIFWDGLGETVYPQSDLSSDSRDKLEKIYRSLFENLAVDEESIIIKNRDYFESSSAKTSHFVKTSNGIYIDIYGPGETKAFEFEGGSDTLVDETATIEKIKEYSNDRNIKSITLAVKVSRGEECRKEPDYKLIEKRYDHIKKLFANNGISESIIKTEPGAFGPEADCKDGKFQGEEIAKKNRYIEIRVEK